MAKPRKKHKKYKPVKTSKGKCINALNQRTIESLNLEQLRTVHDEMHHYALIDQFLASRNITM